MPVLSFMVLTMIGATLGGGALLGIAEAIAQSDISLLVEVPAMVLFGGLFLIPVWALLWAIPSLLVFRCTRAATASSFSPGTSIRLAGAVTATVAALVFIAANFGARDTHAASLVIGLVAVAIAPAIAARTHRAG